MHTPWGLIIEGTHRPFHALPAPSGHNCAHRTEGHSAMTTAPQRFVVRYKKNDYSQHTLQHHAANRQEARIVAMETDAYL